MKTQFRACAAAAIVLSAWPALALDAAATHAQQTLVNSEIEVIWHDKAQGLAQLLADRLGIPFATPVSLDTVVNVRQAGGSTVADLLMSINAQLPPGIKLQLAQTATGAQLEVAATGAPTTSITSSAHTLTREQVASLFATGAAPAAGSWVEQARQSWKASFTGTPGQPAQRWELKLQDVTLGKAFSRWAETAGYRVRWDARKHVVIGSPETYDMPFEQALTAALSTPGIQGSEYPLDVCFYPNDPPLARITRRGDQDKECTQ